MQLKFWIMEVLFIYLHLSIIYNSICPHVWLVPWFDFRPDEVLFIYKPSVSRTLGQNGFSVWYVIVLSIPFRQPLESTKGYFFIVLKYHMFSQYPMSICQVLFFSLPLNYSPFRILFIVYIFDFNFFQGLKAQNLR